VSRSRACVAVLAVALVSASWPETPPAEPTGPGVIFVVDGIGGMDLLGGVAKRHWPTAGVTHEIRVFRWSHGTCHYLHDLQDPENVLWKAQKLAARVREVKAETPDRSVYLVGRSGGAGVVLAAAAHLPPDTLERIVLLSPAVSPDYDLTPAFRATRGEIVNFSSANDQFILNWGTSLFGTVDRVYGPSAGLRGFWRPADDEGRAVYRRLVHVPWHCGMLGDLHPGLHTTALSARFQKRHVAPWLR
jgi:pimeloyl-ACP methyl ester carboxylesterase